MWLPWAGLSADFLRDSDSYNLPCSSTKRQTTFVVEFNVMTKGDLGVAFSS